MGGVNEWAHGSFNVCISQNVSKSGQHPASELLSYFPCLYNQIENPGIVDERLRCEPATFIGIHEHCPEIAILYFEALRPVSSWAVEGDPLSFA